MHIGTRTGAQIRSHAQKFFTRIEKEYPDVDIDTYIENKAKAIQERRSTEPDNHINHSDISDGEDNLEIRSNREESKRSLATEKSNLLMRKNSQDKSAENILPQKRFSLRI